MVKKALLVGINKYPGSPLRGCVNDVIMIFKTLTVKFGFKAEDIKILTDFEATRKNIVGGIKWLTTGVGSGDAILFHYSGHGSQVAVNDWTSSTESDGLDEIICPVDLDWNNPLRDNELGMYFKRVPKSCNTTVILDNCIAGNTEIPLLDGTIKTIKELSNVDGEYWVYSSTEDGKIVPGKAHSARVTGTRELVRITLDNDEVLECTDEHLVMLKDGTYKEAGELKTDDSLMPLYRKESTEKDGLIGYDMCFTNGKWEFTHRMVRDHFKLKTGLAKDKTVCHHKDINKLNNTPENLEMVTWREHSKMHGVMGSKNLKNAWKNNKEFITWRNSEAYRKQQSYVIREKWQDDTYREIMKNGMINSDRYKNGFEEEKKRFIKMNKDPKMIEKQRAWQKTEAGKLKLKSDMVSRNKDPKYQLKCMRSRILGFINTIDTLNDYNLNKPQLLPRLENLHKYFNENEDIMELASNYNHKIISIERTGKIEEVYDLTVEKYHNFAVNSGVIVHNCHAGTGLRNGFGPLEEHTENDYVNRFISPPVSNILTNPYLIIKDDLSFDFQDSVADSRVIKSKFLIDAVDQGDAILLAGCMDNQTSADAWINKRYQGAMTYALTKTLADYDYKITYRDLVVKMNATMNKFKFTQVPQLECKKELMHKLFLN